MDLIKNKDIYFTISKQERSEIKIKGSKFIATCSPIKNREEANKILESIQLEFYDATHNCYAFSLGQDSLDYKFSDDREPSGTAGKPILFAIKKFEVTDILVVVTRYFGGTKLGVGPLARAYSDSAMQTLSICEKKPVHITIPVQVFCTYQDIDAIKRLVISSAIDFQERYFDSIEIIANIPSSKVEQFRNSVTSVTNGRAGTIINK